jgi:hypothetical protein
MQNWFYHLFQKHDVTNVYLFLEKYSVMTFSSASYRRCLSIWKELGAEQRGSVRCLQTTVECCIAKTFYEFLHLLGYYAA